LASRTTISGGTDSGTFRGSRAANFLVRCAAGFASLRRIPFVGGAVSWAGRLIAPKGRLVWVRIAQGPGEGLWVRVNPRTGLSVQRAEGEPKAQQALVDYLRPGMTFYDLGANIGFFSLIAARLVGRGGQVVAFEADPEVAERLRGNFEHNGFSHAKTEEKAVWSEPGTVRFARVDANTSPDRGLGHVSSGDEASNAIVVEATSLDHYISTQRAPDFVKCDVEGAEVAVFQGARQLLAARRAILLVEMHSPENKTVLAAQFKSCGYDVRSVDETHVLALPH